MKTRAFLALLFVALLALGAGRVLQLFDGGSIRFLEDSGSGSQYVEVKAPSSLGSSYTLTLPGGVPGTAQFLRMSTDGTLDTASGTTSLDAAYDVGSSITADAGAVAISASTNNTLLSVTQSGAVASDAVTVSHAGSGDAVSIGNSSTGKAIDVTQGNVGLASASEIIWNGEVNLKRSGTSLLKTDDNFEIAGGGGKTALALTSTAAQTGITIRDTTLYRSAADVLKTDDAFHIGAEGKLALQIPDTSVDSGLTIGGDTNLYRNFLTPTAFLETDNAFTINANNGKATLQFTSTAANVGITIGLDTNLYRSAADVLKTDDKLQVANAGGKTTLELTDTGVDTGLTIGGDTNLYRPSANKLMTDDALDVAGDLTVESGFLNFPAAGTALTISSATITTTKSFHTVDLSSDTTLSTINGGQAGTLLILQKSGAGILTIDEAGNVVTPGASIALNASSDKVLLLKASSTTWHVISFSDNG